VRVLEVPPGFDPRKTLTLQLSLAETRYPDNERRSAFYQRVAERVATIPGVTAAGLSASLPLTGVSDQFVRVPGWVGDRDPGYDADYDFCTPDYFRAMGIPLRGGRYFEPGDMIGTRRVAIINETLARTCFPDVRAHPHLETLTTTVHDPAHVQADHLHRRRSAGSVFRPWRDVERTRQQGGDIRFRTRIPSCAGRH
jgi:hypothetical protein